MFDSQQLDFLAPAYLDHQASGRLPAVAGNRSPQYAPHGVFACAGHEQWLAIAVRDQREWLALAAIIGRPVFVADERLKDVIERRRRVDEIEAAITAWAETIAPTEAQRLLIEAGVPAHTVIDSTAAAADPQLRHQGHFVRVQHEVLGEIAVENTRFHLSRTPSRVTTGGPTFGQHNSFVLGEYLGLSDEEIAGFAAAGALD